MGSSSDFDTLRSVPAPSTGAVSRASGGSKSHIRQLLGWLGDRETQLQIALDAADLGMWHWNPITGELVWSERCRSLLGVAPDTPALFETFVALIHAEDRARVLCAIEAALQGGGEYSVEFRVTLASGEVRWLHTLGRAQFGKERRQPRRMSGVLRDVTESHRAAHALARQRQEFLHLMQASPVGIAKLDRNMRYLAVNQSFRDGFRVVDQNLLGCSHCEVFPDIPQHWRDLYQRGLTGEILSGENEQFVRADGSVGTVSWHVFPWFDESDQIGGLVLLTDLSRMRRDGSIIPQILNMVPDPRDRVHAELRPLEVREWVDERFRQMAESAPIGIVLSDSDGAITYANPAWLTITAVSLGQALSRDWYEFVYPDDHERVVAAWRKILHGAAFDLEFRYQRPSGEVRWVQAQASLLKDQAGRPLGYVGTSLDVTERLRERAAADRLHSDIRALAQRQQQLREVERNELAGSLQEGIYQGLTQLKSDLQTLVVATAAGIKTATPESLVALADDTLNSLRRVLFDLTPPGVGELGFAGALERYVTEQESRSGLHITLSLPNPPLDIHQETLVVLYEVAQQAIANAIEHAHATRIDVRGEMHDETVRLRVNDDGVGLSDGDRLKPGCFGLLAASERLSQIGGTLRVFGVDGRGTTLDASVPMRSRPRVRVEL